MLLKAYPSHKILNSLVFGTTAIVVIVALMIIYLILSENWDEVGEMYYRALAALAVFEVLGTALVPIVKKLTVNQNNAAPTV